MVLFGLYGLMGPRLWGLALPDVSGRIEIGRDDPLGVQRDLNIRILQKGYLQSPLPVLQQQDH